MTLDPNFHIIDIAGEAFLVRQGSHGADMTKIISLNPTAKDLYEHFKDKNFTAEETAKYLIDTYSISPELAKSDSEAWINTLTQYGMVGD